MLKKCFLVLFIVTIAFTCYLCTLTKAINVMPLTGKSAGLDLRNESDKDIENMVIIVNNSSYASDEQLEFLLPTIKAGDRVIFVIDESYISYDDPYSFSNVRIAHREKDLLIVKQWNRGGGARGIVNITGENEDLAMEIINVEYTPRTDPKFSYPKPYDLVYNWNGADFVLIDDE